MRTDLSKTITDALQNSIRPLYVVTFADKAGDSITAKYSTGHVQGTSTNAIVKRAPRLPSQSIDVLEGTSTLGKGLFELQNQGGAVEALLSQHDIRDRDVSVYLTYPGIPWSVTEAMGPWFTGMVENWKQLSDGITYSFPVTTRLSRLGKLVFEEESLAAEPFVTASKSWALDSAVPGGCTLTLSDTDADSVYDQVVFEGNPINILLWLLMSGSTETNDYNVGPAWSGAGLTTSQVNVAQLEVVRDTQWSMVDFRFTLSKAEQVKGFIEKEICRVLGGYLTVSGAGKVGARFFEPPRSTDDLQLFSGDVVFPRPGVDGNHGGGITHVRWELDHDGQQFNTKSPPFASQDFKDGKVLEPKRVTISSRGLQTELGGTTAIKVGTENIFRRFAKAPPAVDVDAFFKMNRVEPGDVIRLSSLSYPNIESPEPLGIGAERLIEVLTVDLDRDRVKLQGLDLTQPFADGERLAVIAPDGQADYSAATASERRYAYICDKATGLMENGDKPYVWS